MRTVVVIGMHRSGTSALCRAVGLLGAEMGPEEHLGQNWENRYLRNVNKRLLDAGRGFWDAPPADAEWLANIAADELSDLARTRITNAFGTADLVVWKDPRTCLTLPFWRPILGDDPVVVLIHRHPYEVARSLEERNRMGHGLSFALWERYNTDALRFAAGLPTTVIKYGDMVSQPQKVMTDLARHLSERGVVLPNDPATTDVAVDASERHHVSVTTDALDAAVATESQRALYDVLDWLDGSHATLKAPNDLPPPHPLSTELMRAAGDLRTARHRQNAGPEAGTARRADARRST